MRWKACSRGADRTKGSANSQMRHARARPRHPSLASAYGPPKSELVIHAFVSQQSRCSKAFELTMIFLPDFVGASSLPVRRRAVQLDDSPPGLSASAIL